MATALLACALATALLTGCSGADAEGVVSDRYHSPAYTWVQPVVAGKAVVPVVRVSPERWALLVETGDGGVWVEVDEDTYLETEVGDWYGGDSE